MLVNINKYLTTIDISTYIDFQFAIKLLPYFSVTYGTKYLCSSYKVPNSNS